MKKGIVLLLVLLSITLTSCTKSDLNGYEVIRERGYIIVGLDDTFAPMGFRDKEHNLVGFDIDLANEVFKELNVEVRFQPIEWNSKELELKSKQIDLIWNGLSITDERLENMLFSNPYLANRQIIISRVNSDINTIKDLSNKKVGVQISSAADKSLSENDIIDSVNEVVKYDTYTQSLLELDSKTIDAVIMDEIMARYIMSKNPGKYMIAEEALATEFYGIGMRLEDKELAQVINNTISKLIEKGVTEDISNKWFDEDIFYKGQ